MLVVSVPLFSVYAPNELVAPPSVPGPVLRIMQSSGLCGTPAGVQLPASFHAALLPPIQVTVPASEFVAAPTESAAVTERATDRETRRGQRRFIVRVPNRQLA